MNTARTPPQSRSPAVRLGGLGLMLLAGGGLLYAIQGEGWCMSRPALDFTIVVGLLNLAVYVWFRTLSQWPKRHQFLAIGMLVGMQTIGLGLVRQDGFAGDGRIIFTWRWKPTPERRLADFSGDTANPKLRADLSHTFPTDSPEYRGIDRAGHYQCPDLNVDWDRQPPRELWRRPVGRGWSSFAVVGDFCVTQEQRDSFEAVVCYELKSGREVWRHQDPVRFDEVTSGPGPRATPTIHDGRVYALGATGLLNCLDGATGEPIWSREIAHDTPRSLFGYSSSPLVSGPYVYVTPGGQAGSIVAVDRATGDLVWSQGTRKMGYSSPQLFPTSQELQVLIFDATGLHGHSASTGELRWSFPWGDDSDEQVNVSQPLIVSSPDLETQRVLISSGYGRGTALIEVACNSSGAWTVNEVWRAKTLKSKFSAMVLQGPYAYGLDEGILTCISLADGSRQWKQGRYGYGQLILVNDVLLIQAESGRVVLVKTDPRAFTELATLDALSERTWNQPVVAGTYLLVRNDREAACFVLPQHVP